MLQVNRDNFYSVVQGWQYVSYNQLDVWCAAQTTPADLRYFLDSQQSHQLGCVGYIRCKMGLTMLCISGDCRRTKPTYKQVAEFYSNIADLGFDIVYINLNSQYSEDYEIGLRMAGLLRPVGLFSTTLSKEIDLSQPLLFDKSWQRNIRKAEGNNLRFRLYDKSDEKVIAQYQALQTEMMTRKHFNDGIGKEQMQLLLTDDHFVLASIENENSDMLAACLTCMFEGDRAVSLYSVTSPEGRNMSASYLLYKEMFTTLFSDFGVRTFDMGRLSPGTHAKNSIFLFKNGVQGRFVHYDGEWLWCKKRWMPLALYFLKKYYWNNVQV